MKFFQECEISISSNFGSETILAENVSVTINRSVNSTYVLGRQNSSQVLNTRADETSVDFSYYIEQTDPIFKSIDYIRTGVFTSSFPETNIPIVLKFAGVSGSFYPSRYSISILPNSKILASTTFSNYSDLSGLLLNKLSTNNLNSGSGLAHAWNARVSGNATLAAYNVLGFSYDLNLNWNSIYSIGQRRPRQIDLSAGQETFTFTVEDFNSDFTNPTLSTAKNSTILISDFNGSPLISINTSGSEIDASNFDLNVDDFAKNKLSLKRTF
jgi:hypothetical protein